MGTFALTIDKSIFDPSCMHEVLFVCMLRRYMHFLLLKRLRCAH